MTSPNPRLWFKLYYPTETIIGSTLESWLAAPDDGIICIVEVFDRGLNRKMPRHTIQVHSGQEYYWMVPSETVFTYKNIEYRFNPLDIGASSAPLIPPDALIKSGMIIGDAEYQRILNEASVAPPYGTAI